MDTERRRGILFIIIGLAIPLFALPFVSGFSKDKGFTDNFYNAGIEIRKGTPDDVAVPSTTGAKERGARPRITYSMLIPRKIPLRFVLVPAVVLVYVGIIRIDRSRRKKKTREEEGRQGL